MQEQLWPLLFSKSWNRVPYRMWDSGYSSGMAGPKLSAGFSSSCQTRQKAAGCSAALHECRRRSGKYWLSEAARQALATQSWGKRRQTVCAARRMQRAWTCEQRNSLWMFDSSPESRKWEFRYNRCERHEVPSKKHAIPLSSAPWAEDNSKNSSCLFCFEVFFFCLFFKQDSFKRP